QADSIPNPLGRFYGAEFIENQDLGLEDRTQHLEFSRPYRFVIRILNFFEQLAIIIEEATDAFAENNFFNDSYGKVCFADPNRADEEQAAVVDRIHIHSL